ncbi:MAG: GntR family transcriptional regulator [Desulfopila sp.]|jgi:DNA-binding GntR family transcriptional regulator|nr:GntR family transcriptional regulator [Desulfopila sp.]
MELNKTIEIIGGNELEHNPLEYRSLQVAVYERIKLMILNGELPPKCKLQEELLVALVGTSKTPIKLALAKLEQEGLVVSIPRRGAYVRELTKEDIAEIYLVRSALEGLACSQAAKKITGKEIALLEKLLEQMQKAVAAKDSEEFLRLDENFHEIILQLAALELLNNQLSNLFSVIKLIKVRTVYLDDRIAKAYKEHAGIFEALRSRDGDRSEKEVKRHILNAKKELLVAFG